MVIERACPNWPPYRSIPESTTQLDGLEENDLRLLGGKGCAHCRAHAHGAETRSWHLNAPKRKCLDHLVLLQLEEGELMSHLLARVVQKKLGMDAVTM